MSSRTSRREFLTASVAVGLVYALPARVLAQQKNLVVATFPGTWNEAHRNVLAPYFQEANGRLGHPEHPACHGAAREADGREGRPRAVRRGALRRAAGARRRQPGPDRRISDRQIAQLPRAAAGVPGQMGTEDFDAGHRHRLQPEQGQDAAEVVRRPAESRLQGSRRPHGAQQPARHGVPCRVEPDQGRHRVQLRSRVQGTRARCCPMSAPSPRISARTRRCGSRNRSTSHPTTSTSCRR